MAEERNDSSRRLPKEYREATFPLPGRELATGGEEAWDSKRAEEAGLRVAEAAQEGVESKEKEWKELVETLLLHRRRLLRIPGVTAVDVGYKIKEEKNNRFEDTLALRVHVERKMPPDYFTDPAHKHDLIDPEKYRSPGGNTVQMDVIQADYKPVQLSELPRPRTVLETPLRLKDVNRRRRLDPLVGGISIGNPHTPVGTLGALVWDRTDGSVCILSNWHVLAGDLHAEAGTPCFQPGRFDQGRSNDVVARLKRWSFDSQTDAAIAELTGSRHYCAGEILSLFQQITGVTPPHLGMVVLKSGRTTEFSRGFIDGLFFSTTIEYSNGVVQLFEDQIHIAPLPPEDESKPIKPISAPGDSGSNWVTETESEGYKAVGLHFAGDLPHSAFGEYALANPMTIVEKRLNFSFRPLFLEIRDEDVISPPEPSVLQAVRGNGIQPAGVITGGTLTGSSGQPDPIQVGPNG